MDPALIDVVGEAGNFVETRSGKGRKGSVLGRLLGRLLGRSLDGLLGRLLGRSLDRLLGRLLGGSLDGLLTGVLATFAAGTAFFFATFFLAAFFAAGAFFAGFFKSLGEAFFEPFLAVLVVGVFFFAMVFREVAGGMPPGKGSSFFFGDGNFGEMSPSSVTL